MRQRRWMLTPENPQAGEFAAELGVSPVVAQILLNRGIDQKQRALSFMRPSLLELHAPNLMPGMEAASARLAEAIRGGEAIVVYGDYDVDGITGTAILWHAITLLGGKVSWYIPHRVEEGYGINGAAIGQICEQGAKLIISVDCGITAVDEVAEARRRGVDVIITDHHEWRADGVLPPASVLVHPRLPVGAGSYPNPHLCGSGVAMKLAWATGQRFAGGNGKVSTELREFLLNATSLAALATIADVVPLEGENRILTHFGLLGLKQCRINGVRTLLESAGLLSEKVDSYHVGFLLAPRLNAAGRMGRAAEAVELLTHATPERAREIAASLDQQNRLRQETEKKIVEEALKQIEALKLDAPERRAIVVGAEGWHAGVIGIVASRIVDRFYRPAIVVSLDGEGGHGSGRSVAGFHLAQALAEMGDLLEGSGGHEMAAGLRMKRENFESFRERFTEHVGQRLNPELLMGELRLEAKATLPQIDGGLVRQLQMLGPFGQGNPRPLLYCQDVELAGDANVVGRSGEHVQLRLRQGESLMKGIAFKFGKMAGELRRGRRIDIAVEPQLNTFNGRTSVEVQVLDIRLASGA